MVVYADTSFLVSLYGQDANSAEAQQLAAELSAPFALTPLLHHEARNAIRFAVFRKDITKRQCESVLQVMGEDIKTGAPARSPVAWAEVFDRAEALSASHTNRLGKCAEENPDLTYRLIKDILIGIEELDQGESTEYQFG